MQRERATSRPTVPSSPRNRRMSNLLSEFDSFQFDTSSPPINTPLPPARGESSSRVESRRPRASSEGNCQLFNYLATLNNLPTKSASLPQALKDLVEVIQSQPPPPRRRPRARASAHSNRSSSLDTNDEFLREIMVQESLVESLKYQTRQEAEIEAAKARDGHVKGIVAYCVNSSRNCSSQDSFKGKRREKHSNGGYFKAEK
jgi:hypothetical protein